MQTTIKVQVRTVYGREAIYPACPQAVKLAKLAGTKTLTPEAMCVIREMGFGIEIEHPSIAFRFTA